MEEYKAERARIIEKLETCTAVDLESEVAALLNETKQMFYEKDEPLRAFQLLNTILDVLARRIEKAKESGSSSDVEIFERLQADISEGGAYTPILQCNDEIVKMLKELEDDKLWTIAKEKKGVKAYFKSEEDSKTYTFKIEGVIESGLFSVLATLLESDLYKEWVPTCVYSDEVQAQGRFRKVVRLEIELPWPMSDRSLDIMGYGDTYHRLDADKSCVLVFMRTLRPGEPVPERKEPRTDSRAKKSHVPIKMNFGGFEFTPLEEHKTQVRLIMNMDPSIKFVPQSLVNYFMKSFCYIFVPYLAKQAKAFEEKPDLQERIKANSYVYDEVKRRLSEHF